jgi:2-polyprenyl-3-methyl-5-hydroxy-6-metoxy-1,4-benzoquinol methylase
MYGSEETDLVVKYYDLAFGIMGEAEQLWYLNKVKAYRGPVLDLGCGTGRMALMLASEGFEVTGIDQSEGMLNQFKSKLSGQPAEVRHKVRIENQKMADFSLGMKFNTVICCDAFFHNITVEEEMDCLRDVAEHLTPNGHFVFNLPNPTCEYIIKCMASGGKNFEERGRYNLGKDILLVEQAQASNVLEQYIETTLRITRFEPGGHEVEKGESSWVSRYLYKYEAIHLLYRCGFEIENLVGDYKNGPVTDKGQLIFDVKLHEAHGGMCD